MFQIENGRLEFWQWDLEQRLIVEDNTITEVHYCNKTDSCSLVTEVYEENGKRYSNVPNVLLQTNWKINVYGYDINHTKHYKCFKVNARSKPDNYIYTETEIKRYEDLEERITALEEAEVDIDLTNYYTKEETEEALNTLDMNISIWATSQFANSNNVYSKEETDSLLSGYATVLDVDNVYGETNLIREELGSIESALDAIIEIQNTLLGVND